MRFLSSPSVSWPLHAAMVTPLPPFSPVHRSIPAWSCPPPRDVLRLISKEKASVEEAVGLDEAVAGGDFDRGRLSEILVALSDFDRRMNDAAFASGIIQGDKAIGRGRWPSPSLVPPPPSPSSPPLPTYFFSPQASGPKICSSLDKASSSETALVKPWRRQPGVGFRSSSSLSAGQPT